jgi:SAM-dependent methyltransferase
LTSFELRQAESLLTLVEPVIPSNDYVGRETLADLTQAINYNSHLKRLIQANYKIGEQVLDFGAGNGHFLSLISDKRGVFTAVEPDTKLRDQIRDSELANVIEPEDVALGVVDLVYTLNVLEHIDDDESTLGKFHHWLRGGGTLFVYVPALPHLYSKFDSSIGHFRRYKKRELMQKVERAGFRVKTIGYLDPVGYFVALIYRLFINSGKISQGQVVFFDKYLYPLSMWFTPLTSNFFGKNLLLVATKV